MRTIVLTLILSVLAAAPKEDASAKDLARMQGDWACDSFVRDGMKLPDDDAQALFRTVKGNGYTVYLFDKAIGKGTLKIDATKSPRTIDFAPAGAAGKGGPVLGIYKLEGNTLTLCYAGAGTARPKAFAAKEGSGHTLTVWLREKK
jgi:uncharacterized protein (TIGR03067 family)